VNGTTTSSSSNGAYSATRTESFNSAVRSIVTLGLLIGFLYGFYMQHISGEVFTAMFASVIGFWFGTRDAKTRASDLQTTTVEVGDAKVTTSPTAKL
jgi:hypothetical protein